MSLEEDTLRSDLEAAVAAEEKSNPSPVPAPVQPAAPAAPPAAEEHTAGDSSQPQPPPKQPDGQPATPPNGDAQQPQVEPAPQAWKAPLKAKWSSLDPDVRQEITRREREILREFGVNNQARQISKDLAETFRPYEARLRSVGLNPIQAVGELLKADHVLTTAPPAHKARYMASLIKQYGVDINELDSALAGEAPNPQASGLEQMLEQRLAPLQQFVQQQQYQAMLAQQARTESAAEAIQRMSEDTVKYPYFDQVREEMADIIELSAKRGHQVSLEEAYGRAVMMNPETAALVSSSHAAASQQQHAQQASSQAQRALQASASVKGAPAGTPSGRMDDSLRGAIEAAVASVEGR